MLCVIILNVVMLSVVAPHPYINWHIEMVPGIFINLLFHQLTEDQGRVESKITLQHGIFLLRKATFQKLIQYFMLKIRANLLSLKYNISNLM